MHGLTAGDYVSSVTRNVNCIWLSVVERVCEWIEWWANLIWFNIIPRAPFVVIGIDIDKCCAFGAFVRRCVWVLTASDKFVFKYCIKSIRVLNMMEVVVIWLTRTPHAVIHLNTTRSENDALFAWTFRRLSVVPHTHVHSVWSLTMPHAGVWCSCCNYTHPNQTKRIERTVGRPVCDECFRVSARTFHEERVSTYSCGL